MQIWQKRERICTVRSIDRVIYLVLIGGQMNEMPLSINKTK